MIVCLCHRISDRDLQRAVREGVSCFEQLQDETRVASSCGCCHDCAREVFDEALRARADGAAPARVIPVVAAAR